MAKDFQQTWRELISEVLVLGCKVSPRGKLTLEIPQHTIQVDMRKPVLVQPDRKLSYKFMAAEAFWILTGDNRVETIAKYNANISQFSDDGVVFFGAYGPKVVDQLSYVVSKLRADKDTRQAGLVIWRENPPATKDVPCTVSIFFNIRHGLLNCHVFMRSSDIWLGVPYDVFNFSMLSHLVCSLLNDGPEPSNVMPGTLYLTAASSHIYQENWESASTLDRGPFHQRPTPETLFKDSNELLETLRELRESKPGDKVRWWELSGFEVVK